MLFQGFLPTGIAYPTAVALGHASVAQWMRAELAAQGFAKPTLPLDAPYNARPAAAAAGSAAQRPGSRRTPRAAASSSADGAEERRRLILCLLAPRCLPRRRMRAAVTAN